MLTAFVVLALLAATALVLGSGDDKRYVTVDFEQTNSVYKGSDVKILGVPVGEVVSLTPRGDVVRAKIAYEGKYRLPTDVKAVVISPSIVGDRFIQLAPAFNGGVPLKDNAFLSVDRSAVPVELDEVYKSLDDLSVALGPKGANKEGSLSNLIDDTAGQIKGQGAQLNETIRNFGKLSTTLSNNKDELFGSLREVEQFVSLLKTNDSAVRSFNDSTAQVSTVLAGEREDLEATFKALSLALVDVNTLIKENRGELRSNVKNLTSLSKVLARNQKEIEEFVVTGPTALTNLALSYNGNFGTLDNRGNIPETFKLIENDPGAFLCSLLGESTAPGELCTTLAGLLPPPPSGGAPPALPEGLPEGLPKLPRSSVSSGPVAFERVHNSLRDMLAVR